MVVVVLGSWLLEKPRYKNKVICYEGLQGRLVELYRNTYRTFNEVVVILRGEGFS